MNKQVMEGNKMKDDRSCEELRLELSRAYKVVVKQDAIIKLLKDYCDNDAYSMIISGDIGATCATCEGFTDENSSGNGWCGFNDESTECSNYCGNFTLFEE